MLVDIYITIILFALVEFISTEGNEEMTNEDEDEFSSPANHNNSNAAADNDINVQETADLAVLEVPSYAFTLISLLEGLKTEFHSESLLLVNKLHKPLSFIK